VTILAPSETALILAVRDLLADGYRVSQEDAIGGLFAFALMFRPSDGSSVEVYWESK
jgi:hypothetical protein